MASQTRLAIRADQHDSQVILDYHHKPMAMLMVNGNGDEKGFGNGGGLAAMLEHPSGFEADSVMVV